MFIRKKDVKDKKSSKIYSYYKLVETIQTERGPRQRVILHLGRLDIIEEERKILGRLFEHRIAGKSGVIKFPKLDKIVDKFIQKYHEKITLEAERREEKEQSNNVEINLNSTDQTYSRSIGREIVCAEYWKRLEFDSILRDCGFNRKEIDLSKVVIFGRLISPGSERHTIKWFKNLSSLNENLSTDLSETGKDSFYEIGDMLYSNHKKIERLLREKTKLLFPYTDTIYLYDLTNTYFESSKPNSQLCFRGKSKEKRSDCPLVTLALIVDQNGFPVFSKIYRGNQSEPLTLAKTLENVFSETATFFDYFEKPSIAMDRGIATKDNIEYLKSKQYSYFVIERKNVAKLYKAEFSTIKENGKLHKTASGQIVYLKKEQTEDKTRVMVYSDGRAKKERSIVKSKGKRYLEDMNKLITSNQKGNIKDILKIQERIGRIKERYGAISSLYDISLELDKKNSNYVSKIELIRKQKKLKKDELAGCYVIETDKTNLTEKEIWNFYMKLSEVESAFRSLKSDLGTRPIFHRTDSRIESHLFISVLAYSILKSIVYSLNQKGYHKSWKTIMTNLENHNRVTIIQKSISSDIYFTRVTGIPEKDAKEIYDLLNISVKKNRKIKKQLTHL